MKNPDAPPDWSRLVMGDWLSRLDRLALKRFGHEVIADEAANHVLDKLAANDWSVLNGYSGRAKPVSYLNAVAANLLEEFSRAKFGRPRPPVWLKKNGRLWVSLWRQVCLERQLVGEAVSRWVDEERSRDYLENILRVIKARMPWCGVKHQEIPASYLEKDDDSERFELENRQAVDDAGEDRDLEELLLTIRLLIDPKAAGEGISESQAAVVRGAVERLESTVNLTDDELLMLRMVFVERTKQKLVAEAFGLAPYQLSKKLKALMMRLRQGLETEGFNKEQILG